MASVTAFGTSAAGKNGDDGSSVGHINVLIRQLQDNQKRMKRVLNDLHTNAEIPRNTSRSNGTLYSSADTLTNLGSLRSLVNQKSSTPFNMTIASSNGSRTRASDGASEAETIRSSKIAATIERINELKKAALRVELGEIDVEDRYHEEASGYPSHRRSIENLAKLEELDELENRLAKCCNGDDASDERKAMANGDSCTPLSVRAKREFMEKHTSDVDSNLEELRRAIMNENFEREMRSRYIDDLKTSATPSLTSLRWRDRDDADLHHIVSRTLQDTANLTTSMYLSGSTDLSSAYRKESSANDGLEPLATKNRLESAANFSKPSRYDYERELGRSNDTASTLNGKTDPKKPVSSNSAGGRESRVRFTTREGDAEHESDRDRARRTRKPEPSVVRDRVKSEDEDEGELSDLLDQSPTYFRELSNFRYTNRHDCFSNQSATGSFSVLSLNPLSPISERLKERLKTDSAKQFPVQEQPIYSYRLNDRLFPVPINIFTEHRSKRDGKSPKNGDRSQQHLVKVCIPENLLVRPNYSVVPAESSQSKVGRAKSASSGVCSSISGSHDAGMRSPSVASSLNGSLSSFGGSKKSGSVSLSVASSSRPRSTTNGSRSDLALRSHVDKRKVVPVKPRMENLLTHYRQQTKSAVLGRGSGNIDANVRGSTDRVFNAFDGFNMLRSSASSADFARYAREQNEIDLAASNSSIGGPIDFPDSTSALDLRSALGRHA